MPPIADDELIKMLDRLLAESSRRDEADAPNPIPAAFIDMRNRAANGVGLSPKQTAWIRGIYDRVFDEPTYENLVSAGKVPAGRPVESPDVLKNLPKKPPSAVRG